MILSYHAVPTEEEMFFIGSTLKRCFSFWVPVQTDISIRMEGKSLDKHSPWGID